MSKMPSREEMAEEFKQWFELGYDDWPDAKIELEKLLARRDEMVVELAAKETCLSCANGEPIVDRYLEKYWHMETGTCRAKAIRALKGKLR